jgi:SAM-dependent methyltransferase
VNGQVFGVVAGRYDEVRPGYPAALAEAVMAFAGMPERIVEIGAGTGKATEAFARYGVPMTCLEPDPAMAAVLRTRAAAMPHVKVVEVSFEDWPAPPAGVGLFVCAQAWHWIDPEVRCLKAQGLLVDGGALALFGHKYAFTDRRLEAALDRVYAEVAPELLDDPATREPPPEEHWLTREIVGSGLFADVRHETFPTVVPYATARYVRLLETFSPHLGLAPGRRAALHARLAEAVDEHGGTVDVRLDTLLVLGRRHA